MSNWVDGPVTLRASEAISKGNGLTILNDSGEAKWALADTDTELVAIANRSVGVGERVAGIPITKEGTLSVIAGGTATLGGRVGCTTDGVFIDSVAGIFTCIATKPDGSAAALNEEIQLIRNGALA